MTARTQGWQEYLDTTFPVGAILYEPYDSFHIPRFWVILDEPSPLVAFDKLEAPQGTLPVRFVGWNVRRIDNGKVPAFILAQTFTADKTELLFSSFRTPPGPLLDYIMSERDNVPGAYKTAMWHRDHPEAS